MLIVILLLFLYNNCNIYIGLYIVKFKVLKLTVNCLPLISFKSRIRKNIYKFSNSGGILHISAKLQGYLQNVMLTNRRI